MTNPDNAKDFALAERKKAKGTLTVIGGREDKDGESEILQEVARRLHGNRNRLVVATIATISTAIFDVSDVSAA